MTYTITTTFNNIQRVPISHECPHQTLKDYLLSLENDEDIKSYCVIDSNTGVDLAKDVPVLMQEYRKLKSVSSSPVSSQQQ